MIEAGIWLCMILCWWGSVYLVLFHAVCRALLGKGCLPDNFGVTFISFVPLLDRVTFGTLAHHFSWQSLDWGDEGAQRVAIPDITSHFWTPVGHVFWYCLHFSWRRHVFETRFCCSAFLVRIEFERFWGIKKWDWAILTHGNARYVVGMFLLFVGSPVELRTV